MATRQPRRRDQWRRTKSGTWTCSLGHRGMRVRLFQKRSEGPFFREVHIPQQGRNQAPLHTYDRDVALQYGRLLLATMASSSAGGDIIVPAGPVRLGELWEKYSTECPEFLDNCPRSQANARSRAPIVIAFFGSSRDVRTLSSADVARYSDSRRKGGIAYGAGLTTRPVRQRSVHADLVLLRTMLRWACTVVDIQGRAWLTRNPLDGLRFERERNPRRPVASYEQFLATRSALRALADDATDDRARRKWVRLELALVMAEATGRRRGAIVGLSWEDIDLDAYRIRWRAEYDKKRLESVVPIPPELAVELRRFRERLGVAGGRLFPRVNRPTEPIPPEMLSQDLLKAERAGKVPKLRGGLWHPYRRKWASERMHLPLKAVADAGGWKDSATLLTCYQHSDEATLLSVMSEPRKRHEYHTVTAQSAAA